ncbi:MAG: 2-oxoglutarate dehydrogenase E1 component [Gammaproteobacteria bacterium]|nr:2-oxoglutarate dehydrogenase E1 component [Gammaproteobacteria bacterium]
MAQSFGLGMQELWNSSQLSGGNAAWLEALYEDYLREPGSVDAQWREFFDRLPTAKAGEVDQQEVPHDEVRAYFRALAKEPQHASTPSNAYLLEQGRKQVQVLQLINAYRFHGHQQARTNPLGDTENKQVAELRLEYHGLSSKDLSIEFETGSLFGPNCATLKQIYETLVQSYCGSVGVEYMHILATKEKRWLQQRIEGADQSSELSIEEKKNILRQLSDAEGLEKYLHTKYVGQKRFSLEGGESLIPMLDELILRAGAQGVREIGIGMAHRGRLNVLVNIMGKTPAELFSEFDGTKDVTALTGDVKYHQGFSSNVSTAGGPVHLALAFNPSHLEIVGPVVEGAVRSRQFRRGDSAGVEVIPVQIHGDAAFSGQGVVMETLQMSQSRGYSTKGTLHIIINNQIGFTTSNQHDSRSTHYCTDIAKMVDAPIFHVNGDDPEAIIRVTRLAFDYRMKFKTDVVIDMICYRRHGHNEADEPKATQPMMYQKISLLPTTRTLYAQKLVDEGSLSAEQVERMVAAVRELLAAGRCMVPHKLDDGEIDTSELVDWSSYESCATLDDVETGVANEIMRKLSDTMQQLPEGFVLNPRVAKIVADRHKMAAGALPIDWGYAEIMAYATLLYDGFSVRLSGQDCARGTFFHRHAVLHNQKERVAFVPLRSLGKDKNNFLVIDSLLSELAVLAFEYGFSTADPKTLTLWEAQFGDFANGAQIVIDQFISSGEHKWGRASGLVMLLPHGYEGQGAEHSSARPERFLQLCAEQNMQVCMPTTPAQIFHLLRRQMVRNCRKPLIVMTPKSLLRHKLCVSTLEDLAAGSFRRVIGEIDAIDPARVERVILCSGKVYYELLEKRRQEDIEHVAIIRVEQLYPFPAPELNAILKCYTKTKLLIWCQEEPMNQGAWDFFRPRANVRLEKEWQLHYVGRESSSAPAVGSAKLHVIQQAQLIERALLFDDKKPYDDKKLVDEKKREYKRQAKR